MGKGKTTTIEVSGIKKDRLYIHENKMKGISKDMQKQLTIISDSLLSINGTLNKLINHNVIKGNRVDSFKSCSKKAKDQAIAADKLKMTLSEKYDDDLRAYPIKLLDERIDDLEKKIANLLGK